MTILYYNDILVANTNGRKNNAANTEIGVNGFYHVVAI